MVVISLFWQLPASRVPTVLLLAIPGRVNCGLVVSAPDFGSNFERHFLISPS